MAASCRWTQGQLLMSTDNGLMKAMICKNSCAVNTKLLNLQKRLPRSGSSTVQFRTASENGESLALTEYFLIQNCTWLMQMRRDDA